MTDNTVQNLFDLDLIDEYRKSHNTSVLAIMFTDIEGFTAFTNQKGDVASAEIMKLHDSVISSAIRGNDGIAVKKIGDSFLAVFADPSLSVKSALFIQQELTKHKFPLKIRIGIHLGQVALIQNISADIFGNHVNIASRVESLAKGGQIFLTRTVYDSAYSWVRSDLIRYKYHGQVRLKGIAAKEDIYQVGLKEDDFSPPGIIRKRRFAQYLAVFAALIIALSAGYAFLRYSGIAWLSNGLHNNTAAEKIFSASVEREVGKNETLEQMREALALEAKSMALRQAAEFLLDNYLQAENDSSGQYKDLTLKDVLALASGLASAQVVSEQAAVEGEKYFLKLTCEASLNVSDIEKRLSDLRQSQNKFDDFKGLQTELERLRNEVSTLQNELDSAKLDQVEKLKALRSGVSAAISAADWYEKALNEKDQDVRIEYCTNAIRLSPEWSRPYNSRGLSYYFKGDYDKAIADFDKAMTLEPGYVNLYNNRGNAYSDKGEFDKAMADFDKAIQLNPKTYQVYNNKGTLYGLKGEVDNAIAQFDKALEIYPNYSEAYFNRSFAFYLKKDYNKALADINKVISLDSEDAEAYTYRAVIYGDKGESDKAISDYTRVISLKPNNGEVYFQRGNVYLKKGDKPRARQDFVKAKELGYADALKKLEELESK